MALGTAIGGWRIIKTVGKDFVKLYPVNGFSVDFAASSVNLGAAALGLPTSTTHVITSSILGIGLTRRMSAVNWQLAYRILWAWVLTIPASAAVSFITYQTLSPFLGQ
jgi:inorganic phosphate transporter, PiT family